MSNPFDNESGTYVVLANEEGQHSLWPAFAAIPAGWTIVHPEGSRQSCLAYIEEHWTDQRPKSLVDAVNRAGVGA
ncbi:MbtH family protein [Streptomyces olivoreticuli]|uniref:MbtH family protein n=1 Tax=Streptomyces olivoreticuli TaxID=68246 RepID=UPI000E27DB26|nr:MbtH family protein [Streptomyces olivoreticuli]